MEGIKLYAMTCGWITMPYGFFMAGETGNLAIPIPCYLIEHPKGTVLFDTGLELLCRNHRKKEKAIYHRANA